MKEGIVTKALGKLYTIKTNSETKKCYIRAKLKRIFPEYINPVAVGDRVKFLEEGVIEEILPRKNKISRRATGSWGTHKEQIIAANIDQVIISFSVDKPKPNNRLIDRFLISAEANDMNIVLCFNKWDLENSNAEKLVNLYNDIGYKVLITSAVDRIGLEKFGEVLKDNVSVIMGPSGVGKSTLLNKIQPHLHLRSKPVSKKTGKGKHVTSYSEMHELTFGGFIIDTPGLRELSIIHVTKLELSWLFPEMREPMNECKFMDCLHKDEPHCGVKDAVEHGEISQLRYNSYLKLLKTMKSNNFNRGY